MLNVPSRSLPYGAVFGLARLVADGPARASLEQTCPDSDLWLCGWMGRLPNDGDDFLWSQSGPVWRFPGGPIALARDGDRITIDAEADTIALDVAADELARRRSAWVRPAYKARRGTLYKYIKNVKSASEGCVTDE